MYLQLLFISYQFKFHRCRRMYNKRSANWTSVPMKAGKVYTCIHPRTSLPCHQSNVTRQRINEASIHKVQGREKSKDKNKPLPVHNGLSSDSPDSQRESRDDICLEPCVVPSDLELFVPDFPTTQLGIMLLAQDVVLR